MIFSILREVESAGPEECAAYLAGMGRRGTCRITAPLDIFSSYERAAYARGYFDAEGSVPWRTDRRCYIQLVQKDRRDLEHLRGCLADLGVRCERIHNPSVRADPEYAFLRPHVVAPRFHRSGGFLAPAQARGSRREDRPSGHIAPNLRQCVEARAIRIEPAERDRIIVRFPYTPEYVAKIRTVPGRRWHPDQKHWTVPHNDAALAHLLALFR